MRLRNEDGDEDEDKVEVEVEKFTTFPPWVTNPTLQFSAK